MRYTTYVSEQKHWQQNNLTGLSAGTLLQIIYTIPVRYAKKVTPFRYRNATSTSDTGTIQ